MSRLLILLALLTSISCVEKVAVVNGEEVPEAVEIAPPNESEGTPVTEINPFRQLKAQVASESATIKWKHSSPVTAIIEYGTSSLFGHQALGPQILKIEQEITLAPLEPDTTYSYKIITFDENQAKQISTVMTFTTLKSEGGVSTVIPRTAKAPILLSAELTGGEYLLKFRPAENSLEPEGSYDTYVNGIDQNDRKEFTGLERAIIGLDIYAKQCFKIQARYTQFDPTVLLESNEICVESSERPKTELNADVAYWKDLFDKEWLDQDKYPDKEDAFSRSNSANKEQEYYYLAYYLDGLISMWRATGDHTYLDTTLELIDNTLEDATSIGSYKGWPNPKSAKGYALWDSYYWRQVASLIRIMHQSPKLRSNKKYQQKYEELLAFSEKNIWERYEKDGLGNFYRSRTHMASHWARIGMELYLVTGKEKYKEVFQNISFGQMVKYPSNLRGQLYPNKKVSGAIAWSSRWTEHRIQDTSHAGAIVSFWVSAQENKMYWDKNDIDSLVTTLDKVVWPKSNGRFYFKNVDGTGGTQDWGRLHEWLHLGRFSSDIQKRIKSDYKGRNLDYFGTQPLGIAALNAKILADGKAFYPESPPIE